MDIRCDIREGYNIIYAKCQLKMHKRNLITRKQQIKTNEEHFIKAK